MTRSPGRRSSRASCSRSSGCRRCRRGSRSGSTRCSRDPARELADDAAPGGAHLLPPRLRQPLPVPAPDLRQAEVGQTSTIVAMLGEMLTAIVTPFRSDCSVDIVSFMELASYIVDTSSTYLTVQSLSGRDPS